VEGVLNISHTHSTAMAEYQKGDTPIPVLEHVKRPTSSWACKFH